MDAKEMVAERRKREEIEGQVARGGNVIDELTKEMRKGDGTAAGWRGDRLMDEGRGAVAWGRGGWKDRRWQERSAEVMTAGSASETS